MVSDELKEENVKLKILLKKHRPELADGDSFSMDDSVFLFFNISFSPIIIRD